MAVTVSPSTALGPWKVDQNNNMLVPEVFYLSRNENSKVVTARFSSSNNNYNDTFQVLPDPSPPTPADPNLRVEKVLTGLERPTSMAFLDSDDIIIAQKDNGIVRVVSNGVLQPQPILQVPMVNNSERGLLGVAITNATTTATTTNSTAAKTVFLYYSEAVGGQARNRIYSYEWNEMNNLTGGHLILDLPGEPGPNHNGGKIKIGPDGMLYAVIGDLNRDGILQNILDGPPPDDTSVIFRIKPNGSAVEDNPFFNSTDESMKKYYAYGIRNSFGLDFDPITGYLWDTENGPAVYDEINVVLPGFNSGWQKVMEPIEREGEEEEEAEEEEADLAMSDLVNFPGSHYADPVFSFRQSDGITDIEFFNSTRLGDRYTNNIFVGNFNHGNLHYFIVNSSRTGLDLAEISGLEDLVADNPEEVNAVTLGTGFRDGITDIETGPDGYLYILTFSGDMYRIVASP
jgi:aldose sugar dehydrogenase